MSEAKLISESFVRPEIEVDESKRFHHLNPFDLKLLLIDYAQLGFVFNKPSRFSPLSYLDKLRFSLSQALVHFYPLAGQLVTVPNHADHSCYIYVDCTMGPGARIIHASAPDLTMLQLSISNPDIPKGVLSLFDLGEIKSNYDGHTRPLFSVQLTELLDGVFFGMSINHSVVDGISFFHFQRVWSHIFMGTLSPSIPLPLVQKPAFLDGRIVKLPYLNPDEFVIRSTIECEIKKRFFKFSIHSLKNLKAMANSDARENETISTFKSLIAFVWKCITRARKLPSDELTTIALPINVRPRLNPPLTNNYFGNYFLKARKSVRVGDLLDNSVGWAATLLHQVVAAQDDTVARAVVERALEKGPDLVPPIQTLASSNIVNVGGSAKFSVNQGQFGLGKLASFQDGYGNIMEGKVNVYLGSDCDGSVDLGICLASQTMSALLADQQFMSFTSPHNAHFHLISKV